MQIKRWAHALATSAATLALVCASVGATSIIDAPTAHAVSSTSASEYLIGTGIYDVTGQAAEAGAFGYASHQEMEGIQQRLYSHAFVIADQATGERVVYVSIDNGAIFSSERLRVLNKLKEIYGDLYTSANVMISATHTHVGPSGMSTDKLYQIAGEDGHLYGFNQTNLDTTVDGIVKSIERAHNNLEPGTIALKQGTLRGVSRNRSLEAYLANDDADQYEDNIDTTMTQLEFTAVTGEKLGLINWFSTHPTQFPIDWTLYGGDTKGYAQYMFEQKMGSDIYADKTFVAAFPNSATGDTVTTVGNSKSAPDYMGSSDDYANVEKAGAQQFEKAVELWNSAGQAVSGPVDARTRYANFIGYTVDAKYTEGEGDKTLCTPARGFSFASGGENGPSNIPGIYEGMTAGTFDISDKINQVDTSALGGLVRLAFAGVGSIGQDPCQAEKPVVLPDGKFGWIPTILPSQILRIGNVAIIGLPGEPTTMAMRHLRDSVADILKPAGVDTVVMAGLTNDYTGYVTTREEYAAQHYEGASTEFGPHEIGAFNQELDDLATALVTGTQVTDDALPKLVNTKLLLSRPGVVLDDKPAKETFGQVLVQPKDSYQRGETAIATFRGGHPKNNLRTMDTFLKVQRQAADGTWVDYLDDHDWDTVYRWKREGASYSRTNVEWRIGEDVEPGTYRLVQLGEWKNGWNGKISSYTGTSDPFTVQ
ncbi:MAG: neutral/alkaline non-lysosomal ceramidase N-terminal domain-containing protein [Actinomycetaceae bacterium]|nr:neutral/alkaline non-lysosomal ceramidase N-terminal domain-containing protein [Actinomycetaceae bacterium]MDY5855241.1 neutral/alkaline non-lysosomal ceramidase N-terminal domain-containing protein [Arcanobacterium sp.]